MKRPANEHPIPSAALLSTTASVAVLLAASPASGRDLFQFTGATTDAGAPLSIREGSSNLPDFIQDLVTGSGAFANLASREFTANLRYGGVDNALRFDIQQGGGIWNARLTSPFDQTVIDRSFQAPSRAGLDDEIENYLEANGLGDLAKFLRSMDQRTIAGSLDGNPTAATAVVANSMFSEYGLRPTTTEDEDEAGEGAGDDTKPIGLGMTADGGAFRSEGLRGESFGWTPMVPFALGPARRVRLELSLPFNYTSLEGADQFRVGGQLGVATLVVKRAKDQPWLWQVTPHAGAIVSGSADLISGGLLASGGVTSYVSYKWNHWEFSMGNHISVHESLALDYGDYSFEPDVSQQILKNGIKVGRSLGKRWYAEAYVIDTEFLQEAFIQRYTTFGVGAGYRGPKKKGYVMVGAYGNAGDNYDAGHFQFGTGWKF